MKCKKCGTPQLKTWFCKKCGEKHEFSKAASVPGLDGLIDKWGREMLRLQEAARTAQTSIEASAFRAVSLKIADFLDDLDSLGAD